jgi:hypothetical protein
VCAALYRNLSFGSRGDDVLALQEFLRTGGYLSANATGYFGVATRDAVARWQASENVLAVGRLGPVSRERIKLWCGRAGSGGPIACSKEYNPVCGAKPIVCVTTPCNPIQQTYGNRCTMAADGASYLYEGQCHSDGNKPPVISGFSGPTMLSVNQTGTWTVQASDPENGSLSYYVDWGDALPALSSTASPVATREFVQTTTFTHVYASAGTYTVSIGVWDSSGQEARSTASVNVESDVSCTNYMPVCGRPPGCANTCLPGQYCTMMCQLHQPQTYFNRCMMNSASAQYLHEGQCTTTSGNWY